LNAEKSYNFSVGDAKAFAFIIHLLQNLVSEKSTAKENFKNYLKRIEKEVMMGIEDFVYEDEGGWEMAKQDLKDEAEENNYLGRLKIMHPRRTGKSKVMYIPGKSEGGRMLSDIGAGAAGGVRSGYSQTKSN
jgi:hypothetical protein